MRIRKRQVPLPLSSLSPIPVSDPHFNRSPMVQLQNTHDPHQNLTQRGDASCSQFYYQPLDHPNQPIGTRNSGDAAAGDGGGGGGGGGGGVIIQNQKDKGCLVSLEDEEDYYERGGGELGEKRSNDTRRNDILGAEIAAAGVLSQLSSSNQAVGRWGEGEKAFPLKKRRGSFERGANEEEQEKDKKMKTKMKTKMNKKFALKDDNDQQPEERDIKETNNADDNNNNNNNNNNTGGSKKRARGGAIMEGSRCSRVNGRGWRCCQQTLVGYSLCEHHLGKGRLRSMNSVRSRSLGSSAPSKSEPKPPPPPLSSSSSSSTTLDESAKAKRELAPSELSYAEEGEDEKPLMIAKKRMKLGMVKARSISSLLGQKDNEIIASDNI